MKLGKWLGLVVCYDFYSYEKVRKTPLCRSRYKPVYQLRCCTCKQSGALSLLVLCLNFSIKTPRILHVAESPRFGLNRPSLRSPCVLEEN